MNKFHNPYHFVPVFGDMDTDGWDNAEPFRKAQQGKQPYLPRGGHSRYQSSTDVRHGRIVCRLTTKTPMFVGAERYIEASESAPAEVAPYELDGQPAIPASSLRGMISAVAEAASHSALRVMEDRTLSYRMAPIKALSAMGLIRTTKTEDGKTKYKLLPIAAPLLETGTIPLKAKDTPEFKLPKRFEALPQGDQLPIKICFDAKTDSDNQPLQTYSRKSSQIYYMNIQPVRVNDRVLVGDRRCKSYKFKVKEKGGSIEGYQYLLPYQNGFRAVLKKAEDTSSGEKQWTRGIVRIMDDMPFRKHQYFIPLPRDDAESFVEIPPNVVETFYALARERMEATKKKEIENLPVGVDFGQENVGRDGGVKLKDDDIVFFDVDNSGRVSRIAFSAIWREPCGGSTHDFFSGLGGEARGKELLPFHSKRKKVSPAEMLFGFVEQRPGKGEKENTRPALAYASRIRFSHGRLELKAEATCPWLSPCTLRILDSPKLPSPAFYFRKKTGPDGYFAKHALRLKDHAPQGRKFYLHHREQEIAKKCWATHPDNKQENLKQKTRITPLRKGLTFWFHLDFENLTTHELCLLYYALKPDDSFHHKLGMGKPLGLGSVKIDPVGIYYIDRCQRYTEQSPFDSSKRYSSCEIFGDLPDTEALRNFYKLESACPEKAPIPFDEMRREFTNSMTGEDAQKVLDSLKLLGDPGKVNYEVYYPQVSQVNEQALTEADREKKHYRWWVANDRGSNRKTPKLVYTPKKKKLKSLDDNNSLEPLPRFPFAE